MAIPDGFDPAPTVPTGGLDRMIEIWEAARDQNDGGYGGGVLHKVRGWGSPSSKKWTSCSPFTATTIGMMFDPDGGSDFSKTYSPKCDNGKLALPVDFYSLHNGFYFDVDTSGTAKQVEASRKVSQARKDQFTRNKWPFSYNDAALSTVFFNLGYQIDPRDMRRGDLVAIDWTSGHGHATFCWDVHLDEGGAVDCFSFLSANGLKTKSGTYAGAGVSISTSHVELFIGYDKAKNAYKKLKKVFVDDDPNTRKYAYWYCQPDLRRGQVKLETFKDPTPVKTNILDANDKYGRGIAKLRVVRFWGFPPPDSPHGNLLSSDNAATARRLAKSPSPPSKATGSGTPSTGTVVKQAPVAQVPKSHPDPIKAAPPPPAPAKQPATEVVVHQHFVEDALSQLYAAGWIDKSPGKGDSVADPQTKAAVEDFQKKHKCPPVDGIPGPITRAGLKRVLADLHAGKPNPDKPDRKPVIDHFCWLSNRVDPGQGNVLAVHGQNLDLVQSFQITLTDQSKHSVTLPLPMVAINGVGLQPVAIPPVFGIGSVITARLSGGGLDKSSDVPLYVGQVVPVPQSDWPWDETKWPSQMQQVVAELRRTPKGPGNFHRREITQYGVKEKIASGDVQVLDKQGRVLGTTDKRSLFLADIEGTMRLNGRILNIAQSGNVYDQTATRIIGGVAVKKPKPSLDRFDPSKSRWVDVTDRAPWGFGAKMPLIPYRVLAHNPKTETPLYGRIVYVKQLDGLALPTGETHNGMCIVGDCGGMAPAGAQFDFFVGREDHHMSIPTLAASQGGSVCEVEILGMCTAAHR